MEPKLTPVNTCIIGINVAIFLFMTMAGDVLADVIYFLGAMEWNAILNGGEYYRLFTSMFLHFDVDHLFHNMVFLFFVGCYMEEALGSIKYLVFYLLSGVGAGMVSMYYDRLMELNVISAGASGAVFGVVGGLLYIVIRNKGRYEGIGLTGILIMVFGSISYGFMESGVDNAAHIGGFLSGFLFSVLLYRKKKIREVDSFI